MLKLAMISFWHVHSGDYAKQAAGHPDTEIVAVWDELPERGRLEAEKRNVAFYNNLDEMLALPDIDGVIIDAPTNMHHEVIVKAAQAGKHIFTEKVIAPTVREVNDILAAVEANGIKLTVSLPRLNEGYTLTIQKLLARQAVGQVTLVRTRLSHNGALANWLPEHFYNLEQCGGGAMIDLGCHPMYLASLFLGSLPTSITATYSYVTGREVEDNAVAVLQAENGAIAIAEAGFVNAYSPFVIEVHGTKGSILFSDHDGRVLLRTTVEGEAAAEQWVEVEKSAAREPAFAQWVRHIQDGTVAAENVSIATELTKLMEAANHSARNGHSVQLIN